MRAFLNQLSSNKIAESDITKADYMTDELMGKIEMVDQTSKNLIGDGHPAQKGSSFLPHLYHNTVSTNETGADKL